MAHTINDMKNTWLTLVLAVSSIATGMAQSNENNAVAVAVENLRRAMLDGDQKALESLSAAELSYGHSSGLIEDQTAFVQSIVTGKNDFRALELSGQTIKMVGKELAIVRHNFKAEIGLLDGSTNNPDLGVLQVWQKKKGQWKLLARQAFKR